MKKRAARKRILHPTDFSSASSAGFSKAVEMAKESGAELVLLHVIDQAVPIPDEGYVPPKLYDELRASALAWAKKKLDALVTKAERAGASARSLVAEGVAHEEILRAVRSLRPELVVMGTHGRTGLTRLVLGSVAARVASMSPTPVLTVRGR
jgi:nucleotide-binding universal stress UspA family protein